VNPPVVPITRPLIGAEELYELRDVLSSGYLIQGPRVQAFESALSQFVGVPGAVAVANGTFAIHIALQALDIGPGSEVIVPDFCFPSVAAAVLYTGAQVALCDVDPNTFNSTPQDIEQAMSDKVRAIIAVHQFGVPCGIASIAQVSDVSIVEDAACALGATDGGEYCGSLGTLGCFSFHPRKILTTGEGGLITTSDAHLAERCRWLRAHGMRTVDGRIEFEEMGFPARMSDVHAAIGLGQLTRLTTLIEGRRRAAMIYKEALADLESIITTPATWHPERVYQSLVVRIDPAFERDSVVAKLRERGIQSTLGTYAIHRQKAFSNRCRLPSNGLIESAKAQNETLTLPLWPEMAGDDVQRVVDALGEALN
jgi:perosamine synthetase